MEANPHEREENKEKKKKDTTNHLKQSKCNACGNPGPILVTPQKTLALHFVFNYYFKNYF